MTAPTMFMMQDSTKISLFDAFEEAGLVRERDWAYTATREEIELFNHSKILLRSTEHPERLRGPNLAWFWMDEPRESPYEAFLNLQAALRQKGYPHQGWCTSTPAGKAHWLHKVWYPQDHAGEDDAIDSDRGVGQYLAMPALTRENPHGGEALYQNMIRTYGENTLLARQELRGEFVLMEGLTYPMWDRELYMMPPDTWPAQRPPHILAGIDFGKTNPSAILVEGIDADYNYYLLDGFYKRGSSIQEVIHEAKRLMHLWNIPLFPSDSADPHWIKELRAAGVPAVNANKHFGNRNNISFGVGLCTSILTARTTNGLPKFFVNPALKEFAAEIESYVDERERDDRNASERPRPKGDHYMDCWRYVSNELHRRWGPRQGAHGLRRWQTTVAA